MARRKRTSNNIQIKSIDNLDERNHRRDFVTCPECDFVEEDDWEKHATAVVTEPVQGKHGSLAMVSECPKCCAKSWVHYDISTFTYDGWPNNVRKKAKNILESRELAAFRSWGTGLCGKCTKLEKGTASTHAWRHCDIGSGPVERECDHFVPVKGLTDGS